MPINLLCSKVKVLVKNCCLGSQHKCYQHTVNQHWEGYSVIMSEKIHKKYDLVICLANKQWEISHVGFLEHLLNKRYQRLRVHRALVLLNVNVPKTPWKQTSNKRYITCHFLSNCTIDITVALVNELRISLKQNFLKHVGALHSFLRSSCSIPHAPVSVPHPLQKGLTGAP